ncbi:hypothetical protein DL990_20070 [Amycolatopsis sp. WAC 01416]|uniref:hypothetical protein n=1 Tax=Amycolatopsis sp. WAC 01416 TaxID=2203196 RepID=UPI000F78C6FC|nr:hypothetical protein [Amycolatopsis sp. WAC 01416]RSN32218.1 hypothetical protein DL990_20070 [Amycolatopsis sp. WAC 01416]
MGARLFVPAVFAELFASMPPKTAPAARCREWLEATVTALRAEIPGPHGVQAWRLIPLLVSVQRTSF